MSSYIFFILARTILLLEKKLGKVLTYNFEL